MSNTNDDYISRIGLGIGKRNPSVFENKGYAEGWNAAVEIIEAAPPADVWPREEVLQAIVLGLAKAGMTIGGRVHQCIFNALPK